MFDLKNDIGITQIKMMITKQQFKFLLLQKLLDKFFV